MAIKVFNKKAASNYPTKRTINFISNKQEKSDRLSVILFAVFLLFLALFVKFGVVDQLNKVSRAESAYAILEGRLNSLKSELSDYDAVSNEYNEIIGNFLNDNERSYMDRTDILKMVQQDVMANVEIKSISISGNRIRISTGVTTLNTVSEIVKILDEDTRNASVTVKSTKADSTYSERVTAEIEILYSGAGV